MNCPNCGTQLPDDATFCDTCGTAIDAQPANNVNDALFNNDTVAYTPAPAKKGKGGIIGIIVGVIALLAIAFVVTYFVLGGRYNGTYEFDSMSALGMTYTREEMEELSGESLDMSLKITFTKCTLDADFVGYEEGSAKIKIKGDEVTFIDDSGEMTGTYDSAEKSITINAKGIEMKFIKK